MVIKNPIIQFKATKDQKSTKNSPTVLPKLGKSTDVLGWLNRVDKTLHKLTGKGYTPLLAYLVRGYANVPNTTDDLIH